ncbi:MAG: hypothetical protein WC479_00335 [Candidatus Izemoplasmatales bacterium]|jgi:hypothetical protein|nr:hypothetical protein [Candidatus Izemoplasmatales bacterium]MDD3865984.1 hypothetical protein [Candidatus Izemoplasmatales bacterium]
MSRANVNISFSDATDEQIDHLLRIVIPFHVIKLAEAFLNQFVAFYVQQISSQKILSNEYSLHIFSEAMNLSLFKIAFDEGTDVITLKKLAHELYKRNYKLLDEDSRTTFLTIKADIDLIFTNKNYQNIKIVVKSFRNNLNAHILIVPIEEKAKIERLLDQESRYVSLIIKDIIKAAKELLDFYEIKSDIDLYVDFDKVCEKRIKMIRDNIENIKSVSNN